MINCPQCRKGESELILFHKKQKSCLNELKDYSWENE